MSADQVPTDEEDIPVHSAEAAAGGFCTYYSDSYRVGETVCTEQGTLLECYPTGWIKIGTCTPPKK